MWFTDCICINRLYWIIKKRFLFTLIDLSMVWSSGSNVMVQYEYHNEPYISTDF